MATAIVALAVIILVSLSVRSMLKDKKRGNLLSCGGDCSKCSRCCH